jgi:Flp pilus assembly pilin Flp
VKPFRNCRHGYYELQAFGGTEIFSYAADARHTWETSIGDHVMFEYLKTWLELKTDRRAVTMLEYAIMGSLIAAVLVLAVPTLTGAVSKEFGTIASDITTTGG